MALSLTNALTQIRSQLDEPNPQFWTNAELTNWINSGCESFARQTRTLRRLESIPVVASTQNYTAPSDFYAVYRIEFVPTATGQVFVYPLEFMGYNEMDQAWGVYQTFPAAWPQAFTLWGNPPSLTIRLFPVPNQGGLLNVFGYREPVPVVNGADPVDVLQGYEDAIIEYATYKAKRKDNDPTWQVAKDNYEAVLMQAIDNTGWYTDAPNQFTTGQSQWPPWALAGSDFSG
jgi:hypothetical protein